MHVGRRHHCAVLFSLRPGESILRSVRTLAAGSRAAFPVAEHTELHYFIVVGRRRSIRRVFGNPGSQSPSTAAKLVAAKFAESQCVKCKTYCLQRWSYKKKKGGG